MNTLMHLPNPAGTAVESRVSTRTQTSVNASPVTADAIPMSTNPWGFTSPAVDYAARITLGKCHAQRPKELFV